MMQWVKKLPSVSDRQLFSISLAVLLGILYAPILLKWYDGWLNKNISTDHEYFSHGMIGFPYAAYVVWQNRPQWRALADRPHPLGAIFLGLGAFCYLAGSPEVVYISLPLVLVGICLWLKLIYWSIMGTRFPAKYPIRPDSPKPSV